MKIAQKMFFVFVVTISSALAAQNQQCTPMGEIPPSGSTNSACCRDVIDDKPLMLNSAGVCDRQPEVDESLVSCTSDSSCSSGMQCVPQTTSIMFSGYGAELNPDNQFKKDEFDSQLTDPLGDVGANCSHARDCSSYHCVSGKCKEKKICRLFAEGEFAGPNGNCGPDLEKAPNGSCQKSAEAKNALYAGLLENPGISSDNQCKLNINQETIEKSKVALRSIRALEWLFSTINVQGDDECLGIFPLLREEVGKPINETRKNILKNYSIVMNQIDNDFQTIISAGEAYKKSISNNAQSVSQNTMVNYDGSNVSQSELGSRVSSGYEGMMLTYRRNNLLKSYEMAMLDLMGQVSPKLAGLSKAMESWTDDSESWSLGSTVYNKRNCQGSRFDVKIWWTWKSFYFHKLHKRYANFYFVNGSSPNNSSVIQRENVKNVLALIGADTPENIASKFTTSTYALMDPPMFGGVKHGDLGEMKFSSNFTHTLSWGGFRDYRKRGNLDGDGVKNLTTLHSKLRENIKSFYKNYKVDSQQKKFIYEPEFNQARDCFESDRTANCTEFDKFLDDVVDEALAHFLAYSMRDARTVRVWGLNFNFHSQYRDYFNNAKSYRRKLLAKLEVDIQNLSTFYNSIISERDKQNACIEKITNGIIDSGILAGGTGGIQEGNYNNGGSGSLNPGSGANALKTQKLSPLTRGNYTFKLQNSSLSKIADSSNFGNVTGSGLTSDAASVSGGVGANLAARLNYMKDKNKKASLAGVNVESKIKAVNDLMKSMGSKYGNSSFGNSMASMGASSASGGKAFGFGDGTGASTSGDKTNEIGNASVGATQNTQNGNGQYGLGNSSVSSTNSDENAANDGTGMNDDEKDKLLTEVQNNKDQFQPNEEDGIFKVVSKAYVRNLDRILIRKKKIEAENSNLK